MIGVRKIIPFSIEKQDTVWSDVASGVAREGRPRHQFAYDLLSVRAPALIGLGDRVFELTEDLSAAKVGRVLYVLCGGVPGVDDLKVQFDGFEVIHPRAKPDRLLLRPTAEAARELPPVIFRCHVV